MATYLCKSWELLRVLTDVYLQTQKTRIAAENRLRSFGKFNNNDEKKVKILKHFLEIKDEEKSYVKLARKIVREEAVYKEFLKHIKGIGETIAMRILSFPFDLEKNITSWWAFAGLSPVSYLCECEKGHKILLPKDPRLHPQFCYAGNGQSKCGAVILPEVEIVPTKKRAGVLSYWNPRLKNLMFIVGDCFIKQGVFYRSIYDKNKEEGLKKGFSKGHAHMHGIRIAFKLFLSHIHQCGCEIYGVPYRKPYQFEFLNHSSFISWQDVLKYESKIK